MATHSIILALRLLWTEEPGGLQSVWSVPLVSALVIHGVSHSLNSTGNFPDAPVAKT